MNKKFILAFAILMIGLLLFCGCSKNPNQKAEEDNMTEMDYEMVDLSAVADMIYKESDVDDIIRKSIKVVTDETILSEQYYLNLDNVIDYEIRSADGKFGVADVAILRVKEGKAEEVMTSLELRKDDRITEFSNYDVLDSYEVAQDAEIYQSGELVVMLMLNKESRETGMRIIESFNSK